MDDLNLGGPADTVAADIDHIIGIVHRLTDQGRKKDATLAKRCAEFNTAISCYHSCPLTMH